MNDEREELAITILDALRIFYKDPENVRGFEKWRCERDNKDKTGTIEKKQILHK